MTAVGPDGRTTNDQRVYLHGVGWEQFEQILAIRGESSAVRITYLDGELELMSPSTDHEYVKKLIARLLEAWAEESDVTLNGFGSWTVKQRRDEFGRGLEPDECYVLGVGRKERPDLAIEVVWTSGGIDKLEIYRTLGVPEVWIWERSRIEVFALRGDAYETVEASELLPDLDLARLAGFVGAEDQTAAVRAYRRTLRGG